jgi:large subunit ribosomal protein L10
MRMARPEKVAAVEEIRSRFEDSDAALLTEYRGLLVGQIAEVRNSLRETGSDYKVIKNTLARIAVREVGLEDLVGMLEGPTAVAFVKGDAAAAAKALDEAAKKFPVLVVKGGVLNGRVIDASQAGRLAQLEPRDVQLAKIAMMMNSPAQQTANVLSALLRNLGSMLAQVVTQKESAAPAPAAEPEAEPEAAAPATEPEAASEPEATEAEASEAAAEPEAPTQTTAESSTSEEE